MQKFQVGDIVKYVGPLPHKRDKYAIVVGYPNRDLIITDYCFVEYFNMTVTYQAEDQERLEKFDV